MARFRIKMFVGLLRNGLVLDTTPHTRPFRMTDPTITATKPTASKTCTGARDVVVFVLSSNDVFSKLLAVEKFFFPYAFDIFKSPVRALSQAAIAFR